MRSSWLERRLTYRCRGFVTFRVVPCPGWPVVPAVLLAWAWPGVNTHVSRFLRAVAPAAGLLPAAPAVVTACLLEASSSGLTHVRERLLAAGGRVAVACLLLRCCVVVSGWLTGSWLAAGCLPPACCFSVLGAALG